MPTMCLSSCHHAVFIVNLSVKIRPFRKLNTRDCLIWKKNTIPLKFQTMFELYDASIERSRNQNFSLHPFVPWSFYSTLPRSQKVRPSSCAHQGRLVLIFSRVFSSARAATIRESPFLCTIRRLQRLAGSLCLP